MKVTFTEVYWRNNNDSEVFSMHALKSITLEGVGTGILTVECACGVFQAPYCNLRFGGGVEHFELTTVHPHDCGHFINIAIFENKVCIIEALSVEAWFKSKCEAFKYK